MLPMLERLNGKAKTNFCLPFRNYNNNIDFQNKKAKCFKRAFFIHTVLMITKTY